VTLFRTIVVVENESLLRDLIARSLEAAGFSVSTAANASDAKRAVKAADPEACVVDIELGSLISRLHLWPHTFWFQPSMRCPFPSAT
jgi:DNA-binding response OmpR family regulator